MKLTLILIFGFVTFAQSEYISVDSLQIDKPTETPNSDSPPVYPRPIKFPKFRFTNEIDSFIEEFQQDLVLPPKQVGDFKTENIEIVNVTLEYKGIKRHGNFYKFHLAENEIRVVGTVVLRRFTISFDALSMAQSAPDKEFKTLKDGVIRADNIHLYVEYTGSKRPKSPSEQCQTKDFRILGVDLTSPFERVTGFPCKARSDHPDCDMTHIIKDEVLPIALLRLSSFKISQSVVSGFNDKNIQLCRKF